MDKITFKQILDEENFNKLKREFLLRDFTYNSIRFTEQSDIIKVDLSINEINVIVEEIATDDFVASSNKKKSIDDREFTINFFNDYLYPQMKNQLKFFKKSFKNEIKIKAIYETSALQRFCSIKLKELNKLIDLINDSNHLNPVFQKKIVSDIELLYQYINIKSVENSTEVKSKIPFNLNKNQVILLFEVMYKKNIISGIHINDLHKLIELYFTYSKESKNLEIKKSKKTADELVGAKSSKSAQPTLDSLEKIFSKRDFFVV